MKFLSLDFETANPSRNSACAIGLVLVEDGQIVRKETRLIKPPTSNFTFTKIHGITWEDVKDEKTFVQIWPEIKHYFEECEFIVCHNAPFDKGVLNSCAQHYKITTPNREFRCTLKLSRQKLNLPSYQLSDVCQKFGIQLNHHEALSDAVACAKIYLKYESGDLTSDQKDEILTPTAPKKLGLIFSSYQEEIFKTVKEKNDSIFVKAVAGSGKTTTLIEVSKLIPVQKKVAFLAFNKRIVDELSAKLPRGVTTRTFHSLGNEAIRGRSKLNQQKLDYLMRDYKSDLDWNMKKYSKEIFRLVGLAKNEGLIPDDKRLGISKAGLIPDTSGGWRDLCEKHSESLDFGDLNEDSILEVCSHARHLLIRSIAKKTEFDFDDMIYWPFIFELPIKSYDVLFVDEAQDISAIQHYFIDKMLKNGGRLIACGDPGQAIYKFRGADSSSIEKLVERYNCVELPLSISYRCPKRVVELAKTLMPYIEAAPHAKEGILERLSYLNERRLIAGDAVLSRTNDLLVKKAIELLNANIKFVYEGEDYTKAINRLAKKSGATSIVSFESYLDKEVKKLTSFLDTAHDQVSINRKIDACLVAKAFISVKYPSDVQDLLGQVERFFDEMKSLKTQNKSTDRVLLSTVHKAKGLEFERVFILKKMPKKSSEKPAPPTGQELNLEYVAVTRAKSELYIIEISEEN